MEVTGDQESGDHRGSRSKMVHYKVEPPPRRSTCEKMRTKFWDMFFPDDPFRHFKGKSAGRQMVMAMQYLFPIVSWLPEYSFNRFRHDFIAGLTIASLAIPQGISYAKLASLPPILGLYSSFIPPLVYAALGSSRDLAVGPVSIASLVLGSNLREVVNPVTDMPHFLALAFTSTLFAGIFQASLGFFRLGFIIDFLSKATLTGFMAGAAIIVSLQQLKAFMGIIHFTNQMGLVQVLTSVFEETKEWSWHTIAMGIGFLIFLLLMRHISSKRPDLFWLSAGAPLASVILSTLIVFLSKAQNHGISIIGKLQPGLNKPSWKSLTFDRTHLGLVVKTGIITGILSLTEGVAVGRTFASLKDYTVDGNKEMMAIGIMNIIGSTISCFVTTGSFSRSAVNDNAGCKTAMSNIVMSLTVMITLLFLLPLFAYTPNVVLAVIIISAVIGLIDIPGAVQIWKMDKLDFLVCMCAFLGVILVSVQDGLGIAVVLSVLRILVEVIRPKTEILGSLPGTDIYRSINHYKDAIRIPGFLIVAVEAPINFANSTYLNERITRMVEEESAKGLRYLLLDLSSVSAIDTSGLAFLIDLKRIMERRQLEVVLVNPVGGVMEKLQRADKLHSFFASESMFLTIGEAVSSLSCLLKA